MLCSVAAMRRLSPLSSPSSFSSGSNAAEGGGGRASSAAQRLSGSAAERRRKHATNALNAANARKKQGQPSHWPVTAVQHRTVVPRSSRVRRAGAWHAAPGHGNAASRTQTETRQQAADEKQHANQPKRSLGMWGNAAAKEHGQNGSWHHKRH